MEGVAGLASNDSADKSSEPTQRSTHGHTHYIEEIVRLKGQLAEALEALQEVDNARMSSSSGQLQETLDELLIEKTNVSHLYAPVPHRLRVFLARKPSTRLGGQAR